MKTIEYKCGWCGSLFQDHPCRNRTFCSRECAGKGCSQHPVHGECNTRLHRIWSNMKARCRCKNAHKYEEYGGRGILVCDEWASSFLAFRDWAMTNGYSELLSIDRKNVDGNYCPSNCRWATRSQQQRNTRKPKNARDSKYKGVCRSRPGGKWKVTIRKNGTTKYCGVYETEEEAARAYDAIAKLEYGEFCVLNFPKGDGG